MVLSMAFHSSGLLEAGPGATDVAFVTNAPLFCSFMAGSCLSWRLPGGFGWEQSADVPVQGLDLLLQEAMIGLLAHQGQELADGIVDQAAAFGLGWPGFFGDWLGRPSELQLFDRLFDQALRDFAATGLLDCQLPSRNHLFTREAHQWSYLPLVLRFLLGAAGSQMRKHLGTRDQLVDIAPPVLPPLSAVVLNGGVLLPVKAAVTDPLNPGQGV